MNEFKLSIVTIAYNNSTELIEKIESIDCQSKYPFENILILSGFSNYSGTRPQVIEDQILSWI